ncbi:MAG: hypothetical protein KF869_15795 [Phycisphaeraceae bacterium]|nr:hypothetical protein [Phycisphaeraceae bacterium]
MNGLGGSPSATLLERLNGATPWQKLGRDPEAARHIVRGRWVIPEGTIRKGASALLDAVFVTAKVPLNARSKIARPILIGFERNRLEDLEELCILTPRDEPPLRREAKGAPGRS